MSYSSRLLGKAIPAILVLVAALVIGCGGNGDNPNTGNVTATVPVNGGGAPSGASGTSGGSGASGTTGGSTGDLTQTTSTTSTTTGTTTTGTTA